MQWLELLLARNRGPPLSSGLISISPDDFLTSPTSSYSLIDSLGRKGMTLST